uniref:Uncharacterized protein n=1 Tax=Avena sativa TaxID=4498 RepID=A0ACD5U0T3_AVESA
MGWAKRPPPPFTDGGGAASKRPKDRARTPWPSFFLRVPLSSPCVLIGHRSRRPGEEETAVELRERRVLSWWWRRRRRLARSDNEFSKIRQRVRYILNRMNYEQSLLEAYASEGWKRQSLEKIRPEKELERAKAEIVRCKLRIREAFQRLDDLLSVGKLQESLFDSEGKISCEDIVCATCSTQDVTLNNDIILCDGVCDRGFHQKCLNPPLLTKDIPVGDEGWLCPACDCKIDCIDIINELQGTDLSINDSWEKVFPEAVAVAHGPMQNDAFDLPSDDSEDDDFDPNAAEEHVAGLTFRQVNKWFESTRSAARVAATKNGTHQENHGNKRKRSSVVTPMEVADPKETMLEKPNACKNEGIKQDGSSGNSETLENIEKVTDLGLPSDDSEDDDYDPTSPDSDKDIEKKKSVSDESDSDDSNFITSYDNLEHVKEKEKDDALGLPSEDSEEDDYDPAGPDSDKGINEKQGESDFTSDSDDHDKYVVLPASGRRQVQSLDSKELSDEANQEAPFDSKRDEDLPEKSTPEKHNGKPSEAGSFVPKNSRSTGTVSQSNEFTPQSAAQNLHGSVNGKHAEELLTPNGSNSAVQKGKYGPIVNQKLLELFKTDQYPSRSVKESLAQELGLTFNQVSKWFESKRRNSRASSIRSGTQVDNHITKENVSSVAAHAEVTDSMETMVEKPNVCNSDAANEDMPSGILNKGIKQDGPLKRDIGGALKTNVSPPNSSQRCTPAKGESREKHGENASSSSVGRPKDGDAEYVVLALEAVNERTKNSYLRELKKRKIG